MRRDQGSITKYPSEVKATRKECAETAAFAAATVLAVGVGSRRVMLVNPWSNSVSSSLRIFNAPPPSRTRPLPLP